MKLFLRVLPRAFCGALVAFILFDYAAFDSYDAPSAERVKQAYAAVVFTGQFERVDAGLRLIDAKAVPRLYISGVNGGAGIDPANFVEQFSVRNPQIPDLKRLVACCVAWGERADNTFQNARDTRCWVERRGVTGPLLLITSVQHMARAKAALSGTLPAVRIIPYPVQDATPILAGKERIRAYAEFLATLVIVRLPLWGEPLDKIYGPFARGCPKSL